MLASVAKSPFDDKDWIFEIKWDGYRGIAEINDHKVRFYSRNGIDFSVRFSVIFNELKKIKHNCILDGEIVLLNKNGLPDFQKLQDYEKNMNRPVIFYVFDLLMLNDENIEHLQLGDRKELLKKLLGKNEIIVYCDHVIKDGIAFYERAREKGLEGIVAKKKSSEYVRGYRSRQWLKIKNVQSTESVIVGYTEPKGERKYFGSLVLATRKGKQWLYRGHVGTGFTKSGLSRLIKKMIPLETKESPFSARVPENGKVTWLRPNLVADISYSEITSNKIFRHPVFLRLRDNSGGETVNEQSIDKMTITNSKEKFKAGRYNVPLTNQQKIFWPDEGYTKGNVIEYYDNMSDYILPYLKNRPLSLKRNPNGIRDEGFYHKDAGENVPEYVKVFKAHSESSNKTIDYIVCNNKATLIYLANLGCIEINPWNSTHTKPDNPTWMVIDIDPSAKNKFTQVVDTALATKKILDKAGVKSYCKTSGASGLHVFVPMKNKYGYSEVKDFAHLIASLVQEQLPAFTTLGRSLKERGDNIYIDYLQNRSGQTLAAAYSLRPVLGALVSAPLKWDEVNHTLDPSDYSIKNILQRVKEKGDLFKPVLSTTTDIKKALKRLNETGG